MKCFMSIDAIWEAHLVELNDEFIKHGSSEENQKIIISYIKRSFYTGAIEVVMGMEEAESDIDRINFSMKCADEFKAYGDGLKPVT